MTDFLTSLNNPATVPALALVSAVVLAGLFSIVMLALPARAPARRSASSRVRTLAAGGR